MPYYSTNRPIILVVRGLNLRLKRERAGTEYIGARSRIRHDADATYLVASVRWDR